MTQKENRALGAPVDTIIGIRALALSPILNAKANLGDKNDPNEQRPMEPATETVMVSHEKGTRASIEIPIVTANSICGNLRRLLLKDMLSSIGLDRKQISDVPKERQSGRILYHTLFSGGTLGIDAAMIPDFDIATEDQFRHDWPMLSLLGASIGKNTMIRAKLNLYSLIPAAKQLAELLPEPVAERFPLEEFDPAAPLVRAKAGDGPTPSSDFARSRGADDQVRYPEAGLKKADETRPDSKDRNIYRPQITPRLGYLAAGTPLVGWVQVAESLTDIEYGVLACGLNLLAKRGQLGGMGHIGFGRAKIEFSADLDDTPYRAWLDSHRIEVAEYLLGERKPAWLHQAS